MEYPLTCHPDTPPTGVTGVFVTLNRSSLHYRVAGADQLRVPPDALPERTDGLWRTTCFELFVRPAGESGYIEYNFAPSGQWAAYGFSDYRAGMHPLERATPPRIGRSGDTWHVDLADPLPRGRLSLTAVIEELDGTRSFWALAHPAGAPDFHHADCFAIDLTAPHSS
ncbi:DOMON-like domain-containing protein [Sphingomonas sp. BGYR3]|uniref:DOMON-like domain-containing protein n=1 Tax=Sphingomonas sp. BGYR3 TaxID=2975483 RepID=UPI0021A3B6DF|nr:DOMON-like domain-containing protein [Sphingomonas sp. BGYR3]MDG5487876.1 DOMON-like domain-containing protein [Sphingomonas sp. BGYR3]